MARSLSMPRKIAQTRISGFIAAVMVCATIMVPGPTRAAPDPTLIKLDQQLVELSNMLVSDRAAKRLPLAQLLQRTGLSGLTPDLPRPGQKATTQNLVSDLPSNMASASVESFRTVLSLMSQVHGGQDNLDVQNAQPVGKTDALTFRSGLVTMDHIRASLAQLPPDMRMRPGQDVLRVPVVLWDDTVLLLDASDHLQLSRSDGAFIISLGRVHMNGSRISSHGGENLNSKDFYPFVTIAGGGTLQADGAAFQGLGFGNTAKFSGLSVLAHPLFPHLGKSRITGTYFDNVQTLSLTGVSATEISSSQFYNMRNNALLLSTATKTKVHGNLFFGKGPTNAVRVLSGSDYSTLNGNVMLEGDRSGIVVQGQSNHVTVSGNVIWRRGGGAIKISKSQCAVVRQNMILNSVQKGVDIRASNQIIVASNTISGGRSSGIWVSEQTKNAVTYVSDNRLRQNKSGLATATGAQLMLSGNDLSDQFPRLVEGDILLQNRAIATNLHGKVPMLVSASFTKYPEQVSIADCEPRQ